MPTRKLGSEQGKPLYRGGIGLLNLSSGLTSLTMGLRMVTFSIYFSKYLEFGAVSTGILFTVAALIGAMFAIPVGALADRMGRKKFIVIGRCLQAIGVLPLLLYDEFVPVLIGMTLLEVGMASSMSPLNAMLADKSPNEKRNETFSRNFIAISIGSSLGAAASMIPHYLRVNAGFGAFESYTPLFVILFGVTLSSLFVVLFVREEGRPDTGNIANQRRTRAPRLTSADKVAKYALTLAMIQLGAGMIIMLFSLWLNTAFGVEEMDLGPLYFVINLTMGLGYFLASRIAAKIGSVLSVVVTQSVAIVLLVALPNIDNYLVVGAVYVIRTMLMNMSTPILTAFITNIVHVNERAQALSISNSTGTVSRSVGPAIGGYLMTVSLSAPFYLCGMLYGFSTALFYLFFRRERPRS